MIYQIYHCVSDKRFTETLDQPRVFVGTVDAISLQDAYNKSQNVHDSWNKDNPCRSTSVGDVIRQNEGYYMVSGIGFMCLGRNMKISKPNTLKTQLEQLHNLARKVADYFDDKRLVTMSVILQNMAFRADVAKESDFSEQLEILKLNAEFREDCHTSQWLYSEADMIVTGYFMSDEMASNYQDEQRYDNKVRRVADDNPVGYGVDDEEKTNDFPKPAKVVVDELYEDWMNDHKKRVIE